MVASRQANQMSPVGVQSQGAQELNPLLAYANMNTPARPQMMNAPATQLREVDKYKYIDSALNRDQRKQGSGLAGAAAGADKTPKCFGCTSTTGSTRKKETARFHSY